MTSSPRGFPAVWGWRIACALMGALFFVSGCMKVGNFDAVATGMGELGMPVPSLLLASTIVLEIGAGGMLICGYRVRWAALALAALLVPATAIFHPFWQAGPTQYSQQLTAFMKNLAILGGLLLAARYPFASLRVATPRDPPDV